MLLMGTLITSWMRASASTGCTAPCHLMLWTMRLLRPRPSYAYTSRLQRKAELLRPSLIHSLPFTCPVMCVVLPAPTSSSSLKGEGYCQRAAMEQPAQHLCLSRMCQAVAVQAAKHQGKQRRIRSLAGGCHVCLKAPFFCLLNKHKIRSVNCCTRRFGIVCKISMQISFLQLAPILLYISSAD